MKKALPFILFFGSLVGYGQPDTSKYKDMKQIPESILQKGKKLFFDRNSTPQKVIEDFKINQAQRTSDMLLQEPQKEKEFQQLQQDIRESVQAAIIQVEDEMPNINRLRGPEQFDSRIELRQLDPSVQWQLRILRNAGSIGLVVRVENLVPITDSMMRLGINQTLGSKYNLCPGQSFATQPVIGVGTAFIINDSLMVTAGHVVSETLDKYAVIFGYEVINKIGSYETDIPVTNIFYLAKLESKDDDIDVAVFRTDRHLRRPSLALSIKNLAVNDKVYSIGYPSGLPEKVSVNARVENNDQSQYMYTSLDAFQGNSGSPVFNLDTHEVIGVLVAGEVDYRFNGSCNEVTVCRIPFCMGEKVIRISEVIRMINE